MREGRRGASAWPSDRPTADSRQIGVGVAAQRAPKWRALSGAQVPVALKAPVVARTSHFVLQHLAPDVLIARERTGNSGTGELSTDDAPTKYGLVDKTPSSDREAGFMIPKRHARRAVTRNTIRRQMRAALASRPAGPGLWLFRMVRAFEPGLFASASSRELRITVRGELDELMARAGFE